MKTRIATLIVIALGLFLATSAFSAPAYPPSEVAISVSNYIAGEIDYPEFAVNEKIECIVVVGLTIQKDGTFAVDAANCINESMKKHVISAIQELDEKADYYSQFAGMKVNVKLKFDLKLV
jgi:hypothetical protein